MKLYDSLKKAIEQNELTVYYQPQISLNNGDIIGVEALVRWIHPIEGIIMPQYFIPLAEESGLISGISEYVLRTACMQNKYWQEKGYNAFNVSVNFNAMQFEQPDFADMIAKILDDTGMSGTWLNLELTESIPVDNMDIIIDTMDKIKNMGVTVSLDDFGAGYSSLNYLKYLPIDEIKLDKTFMHDISNKPHQKEIINSVICLAHRLGITVTAEGVETMEQLNFLKDHNCDNVQGFLISKPISDESIEDFFMNNI
ncbi:EAL domain-containing protein [Clostridium sp. JN-9]|uniref:putative bifunctional diguanylate cyclase/phosphodiesterase n=1 Tax=Clostridium sp. JN-9 TaxID=2507159 RepID=UPI0013E8B56E|nr:EAL domain-containing protein [Clostridium sp. JN-9]